MMKNLLTLRSSAFIIGIISLVILSGYISSDVSSGNEVNPSNRRTCATVEFNKSQLERYPEYKSNREVLEEFTKEYVIDENRAVGTIPVVFHVVYNATVENISDAQIMTQMDVLNKDFNRLNSDTVNTPGAFIPVAGNPQVQFCLAQRDPNGNSTNGITRTMTPLTAISDNDTSIFYTALGGKDIWDRDRYLNIYVCNLTGSLGYAQFPGMNPLSDGCVIGYRYVGTTGTVVPPYELGRTVTHEVGHWFNLFHIWGDEPACAQDDEVTDTPLQGASTGGCPTFPLTDACSPNSPGVMFMNYMDYSDDVCMNLFTVEQSTRMNAAITGPRASLLSSNGCTSVGIMQISSEVPSGFGLAQNYPNPFNPETRIKIDVPAGVNGEVRLSVYDVSGQEVAQLLNEALQPGKYEYTFDGSSLASGMYFYKLQAGDFVQTKKMILLK